MNKPIIYHICTEESWNNQADSSFYIHASLDAEGFIHSSEIHQIDGVLKRYFEGQKNLILLTIDPKKLHSKLQYDPAPSGEDFPHIYGPLNKDAILEINKIDLQN